ncbi:alpha/beta fold hydrolase [Spirosoma fluviale]|uniref:Pimeloyl-ACP methyl ester carboxylesterase n=1 Tax=Spirosoma fluviale TaxID=1597977 RepID=A0A286GLA4_9BACT|nr:alpha/beta hydrolase [Spirosoma fluviale]SOD95966.1 Pimeloyl-ACP methyl ester carboxylesterase [Spirosoma fluviale]
MFETADSQQFTFQDSRITYQKFGNGPVILLAFHGFGQSSHVFKTLENSTQGQFTIFAIDLFFHGNSHYLGHQLLTKAVWCQLIGQFLQAHAIDRFSLMGFSLGGRFALVTAEAFANRLDQLILIAPDGITRNGWYLLATSSVVGRALFRYVMHHLSMLSTFGHLLTRLGFLNKTIMRFAEISLATPEQRALVYRSWTQFRLIRPNLNAIAKTLREHSVQVRFFTGAFDRIIPGSYILPLTDQLPHYELTVLKTGHNRLIEMTGEKLA